MVTSDRWYAEMLRFVEAQGRQQKIMQICQSLRDLFKIDAFFYSSISKQGKYLHLGTRPDILEDYLYSGQLLTSPTLSRCHYTVTPAIHIWQPQLETKESLQPICQYFKRNRLVSGVSLTIYKETGRDIYYFGTHEVPSQGEDYWYHIVPALYEFIQFFSLEIQTILEQSESSQIELPELIGESFYETPGAEAHFSELGADDFREVLFQHALQMKGLTEREKSIFSGCLLGKTAKQIAEDLSLSYRTVQNNLQQIKEKFNVGSQREMMALFCGQRRYAEGLRKVG